MRVYEPTIVDGEQRVAANIISVSTELIAFGELLPERGKALELGTPIHTLLIHLDGPETMFELCDQGNTRDASDVERVELAPTSLRGVFAAGRGPYSGRVSLAPEIEFFDHDAHASEQLRSVLVEMKPTATQLAQITQLLVDAKLIDGAAPKQRTRVRRTT